MMLKFEYVIVWFHLFAGLLGGQSRLAGLLFAHECGPASGLGYPDSGHASFLLVPTDGARCAGTEIHVVRRALVTTTMQ